MNELTRAQSRSRAAALAAGERRVILGLTGAPGAGKSTLAQELSEAAGERGVIVPMDGFHLANVELARLGRSNRKGAEDTFDSAGYVALLRRLRDQPDDEIVYAPEFRRAMDEGIAGAIAVLPQHRLVITEGNYLLLDRGHWAHVRGLVDEIWYIDVDDTLRLDRLIARHQQFGRNADDAVAWVTQTDEPNAVRIAATRPRADAVVLIEARESAPL